MAFCPVFGERGTLVHQVCDRYRSAVANFGWVRDAMRANTRSGLQPTSNKASGQNRHKPFGFAEAPRGVAGSLNPIPRQRLASPLAALPTLLFQSQTWCTGAQVL